MNYLSYRTAEHKIIDDSNKNKMVALDFYKEYLHIIKILLNEKIIVIYSNTIQFIPLLFFLFTYSIIIYISSHYHIEKKVKLKSNEYINLNLILSLNCDEDIIYKRKYQKFLFRIAILIVLFYIVYLAYSSYLQWFNDHYGWFLTLLLSIVMLSLLCESLFSAKKSNYFSSNKIKDRNYINSNLQTTKSDHYHTHLSNSINNSNKETIKRKDYINWNSSFDFLTEIRKKKISVLIIFTLIGISYLSYYANDIIKEALIYYDQYISLDKVFHLPRWLCHYSYMITMQMNSMINYLFNNMIIRLSVLFEFIFMFMFMHRILGYGLGWYLRKKLDPKRTGKFNFHFEWISFRIGMDMNMIVIHGFEWRNPPGFKHTPYLLKINELSIIVDIASLYKAIISNTSIHIKEIRISRVNFHLEKYTEGIEEDDDEESGNFDDNQSEASNFILQEEIVDNIFDLFDYLFTKKKEIEIEERNETTLKNGVLNLYAALGALDIKDENTLRSDMNVHLNDAMSTSGRESNMGHNAAKIFLKTTSALVGMFSTKIDPFKGMDVTSKSDDELKAKFLEYDEDKSGFLDSIELSKLCSALGATLTEELLKDALAVLDENGDGQISIEEFIDWWKTKNKEDYHKKEEEKKKELKKVIKTSGFGVPYTFEIDHLLLDHLELNAQDILNAFHSKSLNLLKVQTLHMFKVDLTLPPDTNLKLQKGEKRKRKGIFLDDFVWKLVNRLITELIYYNSISMMILLSSAATNNITSTIFGNISSKVQSMKSKAKSFSDKLH